MTTMVLPPAPSAILFDWDNTLVDTWPVIHEANRRLFEYMGREPWGLAEVKANVRKSLRETFPELFGDRWEEARDVFYRFFNEIHLEALEPFPTTPQMLRDLGGHGIPLGVVSNKSHDALIKEIDHLGWAMHFDVVVGAGVAPRDKPDPAHAQAALAHLDMDPSPAVWYVGDTDVDMILAGRSGLHGVLIASDEAARGADWEMPPKTVCADLSGLSGLVARLMSDKGGKATNTVVEGTGAKA